MTDVQTLLGEQDSAFLILLSHWTEDWGVWGAGWGLGFLLDEFHGCQSFEKTHFKELQ